MSEEKFGLLFTEDGLIISPALEVDGISFEEFKKDNTGEALKYVSTVGENTATIGYGKTPATPLDAYDFGVRRANAVYNDYEPAKSSAKFNQFYSSYLDEVKSKYNLTFNYIIMRQLNTSNTPYILFSTNYGSIWFDVSFTVENGIVKFKLTGETNAPTQWKKILQPLLDTMILAPEGYYLKNTGGLLTYSNRTFSMINVADPSMWINYYDF